MGTLKPDKETIFVTLLHKAHPVQFNLLFITHKNSVKSLQVPKQQEIS
jgi:hypothetical protein